MANLDRIRQVVALIEEDERDHEGKHFFMGEWIDPPNRSDQPAMCNTAMCFAGWAGVAEQGSMEAFLEKALRKWEEDGQDFGWETTEWGRSIQVVADRFLELGELQGDAIYYQTRIRSSEGLKEHITNVLQEEIWVGVFPDPHSTYAHLSAYGR